MAELYLVLAVCGLFLVGGLSVAIFETKRLQQRPTRKSYEALEEELGEQEATDLLKALATVNRRCKEFEEVEDGK